MAHLKSFVRSSNHSICGGRGEHGAGNKLSIHFKVCSLNQRKL